MRNRILQQVRVRTLLPLLFVSVSCSTPACAQKRYDPGASDAEIRIGSLSPNSGSLQEYGAVGRAEAAYFRMINDRGGVNGRKIIFLSEGVTAEPATALELARKLVEQDKVLFLFSPFGTENNLAIRGYMNDNKVPQLFLQSSSAVFADPARFPWTMGFFATFKMEGIVYAKYILQNKPGAKIAVLYAEDGAGLEYRAGLREGLGEQAASLIAKELSYRPGETATIDAHIAALKASGADTFFNFSLGRDTTHVIRQAWDADWHPLQFIPNASLSVAAFLDPAGLDKSAGIISNARSKGWWRPEARKDPTVTAFLDWMASYNPEASPRDQNVVAGYERAEVLVEVLKKCGDTLTRANVMKQAASLDLAPSMFRAGIRLKTGPTDYQPVKQLFLVKFNGREWTAVGPVTSE